MASTAAVSAGLIQFITSWAASVATIAARDPAAFYQTDGDQAGMLARLTAFITNPKWDDSLVIRVTNSDIRNFTERLNRVFGAQLTAPQFQGPAIAPDVLSPPLAPEVVATFGTGVDLSAIDPAIVEAAAILAPESEAAAFVAALAEPPAPPLDIFELTGEIQPDAQLSVAAPILPARPMNGNGAFDPFGVGGVNVFGEPTFGTPTIVPQPIPSGPGGFDLTGAGFDLLAGLIRGESFSEALIGGVGTGLGITSTGDTPGALPQPQLPGVAPDTQRAFLEFLKRFPPTAIPANVVDQFWTWLNAGQPAAGAPFAPTLPTNGQIPGGLNGRACDFPTTVNTTLRTVHSAPPGFVVVECVGSNGILAKQAMWKPLAIKLGLWRAPKKPPVSATDWSTVKKAKSVEKRVRRTLGTQLNMVARKAPTRRKAATCK